MDFLVSDFPKFNGIAGSFAKVLKDGGSMQHVWAEKS
jgi:hypothetical protein